MRKIKVLYWLLRYKWRCIRHTHYTCYFIYESFGIDAKREYTNFLIDELIRMEIGGEIVMHSNYKELRYSIFYRYSSLEKLVFGGYGDRDYKKLRIKLLKKYLNGRV